MSWIDVGVLSGIFLTDFVLLQSVFEFAKAASHELSHLVSVGQRTKVMSAGVVTCVLRLQVVYFYPDMDIALLKEVVAQNPFQNTGKWREVTEVVNATIQQTCPSTPDILERTLKEHLTTLLKHFEQDNNSSLKKYVTGMTCFWLLSILLSIVLASVADHSLYLTGQVQMST